MGSIHRPLDSVSGITEAAASIKFVDDLKPYIHALWCMGFNGIIHEAHTTARVEVTAGTVREFMTDYLSENGGQIKIVGQLSVNNSAKCLSLSDQAWGS